MATPQFNTTALEQRVRERADMVGSLFVSSTEIASYMEASWQELYTACSVQSEDLFVKQYALTITGGTAVYPLSGAADIKKLRGVRIKGDVFLSPLSLREVQNLDRTGRTGKPRFYWMYGDTTNNNGLMALEILPPPDNSYSLLVFYQPAIQLADVSGLSVLPMLAGFDEFIVVSAAMKCKNKEESDCSLLMTEKQSLLAGIIANLTPVDTSEAAHVVSLMGGRSRMRAYDYTGPDDDY